MRAGLKILILAALLLGVVPVTHAEEVTLQGEVLDLACYIPKGAKGPDHADCAKKCVKAGQPMGLLTEDGAVLVLAADHADGKPYEALKDWAGEMVKVTGDLSERDGIKVFTVTASHSAG